MGSLTSSWDGASEGSRRVCDTGSGSKQLDAALVKAGAEGAGHVHDGILVASDGRLDAGPVLGLAWFHIATPERAAPGKPRGNRAPATLSKPSWRSASGAARAIARRLRRKTRTIERALMPLITVATRQRQGLVVQSRC
jgi:hypothetical protein